MANPPSWSNVVLRLTMDGTIGSTTFTDLSNSAHTMSVASVAAVETSAVKFGSGALDVSGSTGAALQATATLGDFGFGTGQFTVECWGYATSAPGSGICILAGNYGTSSLGFDFGMVTGALAFYYSTTGSDNNNIGSSYTPALNTWVHYAVDRDASNVLRVYANGVVIASATVTASLFTSTNTLKIGNDGNLSRHWPGYIDDLRIVKGEAVYGGAFTPPSAALPTSGAVPAPNAFAVPQGGYFNATGTRQHALPAGAFINDTAIAPTPPPSGAGSAFVVVMA